MTGTVDGGTKDSFRAVRRRFIGWPQAMRVHECGNGGEAMGNVNGQFVLSTLVIALGYLLKRTGLVSEKDGAVLTRVLLNVTLPALVVSTFSAMHFEPSLMALPAICLAYGIVMGALGLFVFRRQERADRGLLAMLVPGFNIALFAYPLVEAILGKEALIYLGMFDVGVAFVGFVIAYLIGYYFSPGTTSLDYGGMARMLLRSVPFMAYIVSLLISVSGLHYPGVVVDLAKSLARANMPLALLLLGIYLNFRLSGGSMANVAKVLGLRYGLGLAVGISLYFSLPFNQLFRDIVLVSLILPPPLMMIAFAVEFSYDYRLVGIILNIANVTSYLLLWIIFNCIA